LYLFFEEKELKKEEEKRLSRKMIHLEGMWSERVEKVEIK